MDNKTSSVNKVRRKWREHEDRKISVSYGTSESLKNILYRLAYKQLSPGEWKRLAMHWAFTDEQIRAIEHQYTGSSSHKEHGFRMMLIWSHGLGPDVNPVKELYESLTAIGNKKVADALRKKIDKENKNKFKTKKKPCCSCTIM